jgi:hypothetical protein
MVVVGDDADDDDGALSRIYFGYRDMFPFGDGEVLLLSLLLCVLFVFGSDSLAVSDSCFSLSPHFHPKTAQIYKGPDPNRIYDVD